jgi:polyisoprenoid-binding protein YceI
MLKHIKMAKWNIDASHSEVQFKVKHLMISTVTGSFGSYSGEVVSHSDDDFTDANASFSLVVNSISTGQEQRDGHLKSADFFDAEKFPTLSFKSTSFIKKDNENYLINGDLTIKETTKSISLEASLGGIAVDPYGQTKAGFDISGKINRQDFGLTWSAVTEAGGIVVSDEVKLILNIQLVKS